MCAVKSNNGLSNTSFYKGYLWDMPIKLCAEERLYQIAHTVCLEYRLTRNTRCIPSFYPYAGLKSTIRIVKSCTVIRLSDILRGAPSHVLHALIHILIARASRIQPDEHFTRIYNNYTVRPDVESRHADTRLARSRKVLIGPVGQYFDLNVIFRRINRRYFDSSLEKPEISWSPKRSRKILGYHDSHLNLIVISRWLDRKSVPPYVVDYLMYHELLHIVIPPVLKGGKRIVHSREFKQREREFVFYDEAIQWLKRPGMGSYT